MDIIQVAAVAVVVGVEAAAPPPLGHNGQAWKHLV